MIHFACFQCGSKFKVKDEFAGRSTKCPTCKNLVHIPDPSKTRADIPAERIDGSESSLDKAGVNPSITLAPVAGTERASVDTLAQNKVGRYIIDKELARGGMGTVLLGVDRDIRREVAIKFMLNEHDAGQKARFVEEAQITGQLEHPNIVPVHELGVDAKKRLFFTMKMVKGRSLAQVLEMLAKDPKVETEWSLSRRLVIVVNICHALAYAHSRNVIHRDLKPANIMVGDFGEVYVMDWGLAKVLGEKAPIGKPSDKSPKDAISAKPPPPVSHSPALVSTSREAEAELTQDGAILGTPAYMPPEQALGNVQAIDQRSDIYSLGAILYATLTLQPPVEKGSDHLALLMRVAEGEIKRPEVRTPTRHIPQELSAITMKALAKDPASRYQTVEAFRRDVELFLEGRSVSAKQDTIREQVWKLVKRNKAASLIGATAAVLLTVVLAWSSWSNYRAYQEADKANKQTEQVNADLVVEKQQKQEHTQRAIPAFVQAAHTLAAEGKFDDALAHLDYTLEYDPKHAEARFYKGRLLIAQKKFAAGRAELEKYLELKPKDVDAKALVNLCAPDLKDDLKFRAALVGVFQRQGEYTIAARLLEDKRDELEARKLLLATYQAQVEKKWPGMGQHFRMWDNGSIGMDLREQPQLKSLEQLRGLQLEFLWLMRCPQLTNLSPLKDMPLVFLDLAESPIKDFSPLATMPLEWLSLQETGVHDLSMLKGMMTLRTLSLSGNPKIDDLTPLKGLELITLDLNNCQQVPDLRPLAGMPLRTLHLGIAGSRVKGFAFLAELKDLKNLSMENLPIGDKGFSNVKDLRLKDLDISGTKIQSLAPLKEMKLNKINLSLDQITPANIDILRAMPSLKTVVVDHRPHAAAGFYKRYDAGEFNKK